MPGSPMSMRATSGWNASTFSRVSAAASAEDATEQIGANARAGVGHPQDGLGARALDGEADAAARRRVLERAVEEIPDHLLQAGGIAVSLSQRAASLS